MPDVEDAGDLLVERVQQPGLVELAGDRARQLVQHRELLAPGAGCPGRGARSASATPAWLATASISRQLGLAEIARPSSHQPADEAADHLLLGHDRHEELACGAAPLAASPAGMRGSWARVGGDHRAAGGPPRA